MKVIPLTHGLEAIVDDDAPSCVFEAKWYAKKSGYDGYFYAVSKSFGRQGVRLHRLIVGAPEGMCVDHINGDTLDNRRCNLRVCTNTENLRNRKLSCRSKTGFKGVSILHRLTKDVYAARITTNGKKIQIGVFATPEEAARAYDKAASDHFGRFARPNFPTGQRALTRDAA
ncbi:HNH endonuclease [Luteibacter sp. NPDC031894]|uniref:HNH endonuclease n=1 Tax=Luteibacter sp. NPDC031894 TaxID=3390572 RepID=UPI003D062A24